MTYQIVDVEQTYHKDMDTVLQEQKQAKKALPTLFVSDHVKNPEQYGLVSYKDTVYQEMQPEDYYYLSVYQDSHPSMYEMPTSFDVLLFYAIGEQQDDSWKISWKERNSTKQFAWKTKDSEQRSRDDSVGADTKGKPRQTGAYMVFFGRCRDTFCF